MEVTKKETVKNAYFYPVDTITHFGSVEYSLPWSDTYLFAELKVVFHCSSTKYNIL